MSKILFSIGVLLVVVCFSVGMWFLSLAYTYRGYSTGTVLKSVCNPTNCNIHVKYNVDPADSPNQLEYLSVLTMPVEQPNNSGIDVYYDPSSPHNIITNNKLNVIIGSATTSLGVVIMIGVLIYFIKKVSINGGSSTKNMFY